MTQNFVRYSPDVEQLEPDFEQTLQTVLDNMKQRMRGSLEAEGIGRIVRDAHAKGYGLARGEVEIQSGLPSPYAQGIIDVVIVREGKNLKGKLPGAFIGTFRQIRFEKGVSQFREGHRRPK
jgi:hypothetical protein